MAFSPPFLRYENINPSFTFLTYCLPEYQSFVRGNFMSKEQTIQDVMGRIAARLEVLQADLPVRRGFLSAIDAYITVDPLLGVLHKQLLDAQMHCARVRECHGADAPMAEIATDMAESAECDFRTRLIEVRHDHRIRREVLKILRRQRAQVQREHKKRDIFARIELAAVGNRKLLAARAKKEGEDSFATVMMLLLMLQHALRRTQKMLSLASDFSAVSLPRHKIARSA